MIRVAKHIQLGLRVKAKLICIDGKVETSYLDL
uniref:Uncharacterized protein n=1 Tax=Nelumbo nucifera TaxID=4432 RepID=A0A822ZV69_NELNU|nr:TPA_asm: hypothetical protein HUJ06_017358 [Nelumbo nucifera]